MYHNPVLERPNVYCNMWGLTGWLDDIVHRFGAEKLMYGSDAFMNPRCCGIGPIIHLNVPDEDKRLMLGLNIARLLDSVGALPPCCTARWLRIPYEGITRARGGEYEHRLYEKSGIYGIGGADRHARVAGAGG